MDIWKVNEFNFLYKEVQKWVFGKLMGLIF